MSKYEDYLTRLRTAREEWAKRGFETARTRIGVYERAIERLIAIGDYSRISQVLTREEGNHLILLFGEIQEFLFVSEHILAHPRLLASPRVRFLFSGPELSSGERAGPLIEARNTAFEFHIAALLSLGGLPVDMTGIADLITAVASFSIVVECKRPQRAAKIGDNIRRAIDQIAIRKANASQPTLGVIALSIGKAITAGDKLLIAPNVTAMESKLDAVSRQLIGQHDPVWFKGNMVDGILLHVATSGVDDGASRPYHATMLYVRSRPDLPEDRKAALRALYSAIERGMNNAL